MKYEVGKRYTIDATCKSEIGTYMGAGTGSYYGIEFYFSDEDDNTLTWRTTGHTQELPIEHNRYRISATVRKIEDVCGKPWVRVSHVKIKKHLGRVGF